MKTLKIDYPGDGDWIMGQAGAGRFTAGLDHSITAHEDGELIGGFVVMGYTSISAVIHMAGRDRRWCSRDLMWMLFDYCFYQLGCRKLLATVSTGNTRALELDLRAGWKVETIVWDVYPDGHMVILSMDQAGCKWLKHVSKNYQRGGCGELAGG